MSQQQTLQVILNNNSSVNRYAVNRVLLLYEEKIFLIGDACINFNELRHFRAFFPNAAININFLNKQNSKRYEALLKNNPYVDELTAMAWDGINFEQYDIIICITYNEEQLLTFLDGRYTHLVNTGKFKTAVFSVSQIILQPDQHASYVFPMNEDLVAYVMANPTHQAPILYISEKEQEWGNQWLRSKGLKANEQLFILLDSTTRREKLLDIDVYFEFLASLVNIENVKVLIYDEKIIGKEQFYTEWLGAENAGKIIFSKGLDLREDLCIIASRYTKMVFGPCTGLMHCAAGIYNHSMNRGIPVKDLPLLITYTGQYPKGQRNAAFWWGNLPWVNCLWLKKSDFGQVLQLLGNITEDEMDRVNPLPCTEYTAGMLFDFIQQKLVVLPNDNIIGHPIVS